MESRVTILGLIGVKEGWEGEQGKQGMWDPPVAKKKASNMPNPVCLFFFSGKPGYLDEFLSENVHQFVFYKVGRSFSIM